MISITVPSLDALIANVNRYPEIAEPIMRDAAYAALLSLIPDLAIYPEQSATTKYRRRGAAGLGGRWYAAQPVFEAEGNGFEVTIGNATPYGPFVQGGPEDDPHQTQVMADLGWSNVAEVVAAHQGDFDAFFEAALNKILLQIGSH